VIRTQRIISKGSSVLPLPSRDTRATPNNPLRDARVSDEVWECLQQDKAAAEAHEQEHKRLPEHEAALRELATAAERKTDSATAATLEEATRYDADDEAKRHREEARLRHELERRAREAGAGGAEAQAADGGGAAPVHIPSLRLASKPSRSYPYEFNRMCTQRGLVQISVRKSPRQMTASRPLTNSGVSESFRGLKSLSNLGRAVLASSAAMEALLP
jgi:hypothetical protein